MLTDAQRTALKLLGFTIRPGTIYDFTLRGPDNRIVAIYEPTPNRTWHISNTEHKQTLKEILNEKFPLGDN